MATEKQIASSSFSERTISSTTSTEKDIAQPNVTVVLEQRPLIADGTPLEWPFSGYPDHYLSLIDADGTFTISTTTDASKDQIEFSMPSTANLVRRVRFKVTHRPYFLLPGVRTRYRLQYRVNDVLKAGFTGDWYTIAVDKTWLVEFVNFSGLALPVVSTDVHEFRIICDIDGPTALFQVDQVLVNVTYDEPAPKTEKTISSTTNTGKVISLTSNTERAIASAATTERTVDSTTNTEKAVASTSLSGKTISSAANTERSVGSTANTQKQIQSTSCTEKTI